MIPYQKKWTHEKIKLLGFFRTKFFLKWMCMDMQRTILNATLEVRYNIKR